VRGAARPGLAYLAVRVRADALLAHGRVAVAVGEQVPATPGTPNEWVFRGVRAPIGVSEDRISHQQTPRPPPSAVRHRDPDALAPQALARVEGLSMSTTGGY
jgi:hypothetical protein